MVQQIHIPYFSSPLLGMKPGTNAVEGGEDDGEMGMEGKGKKMKKKKGKKGKKKKGKKMKKNKKMKGEMEEGKCYFSVSFKALYSKFIKGFNQTMNIVLLGLQILCNIGL